MAYGAMSASVSSESGTDGIANIGRLEGSSPSSPTVGTTRPAVTVRPISTTIATSSDGTADRGHRAPHAVGVEGAPDERHGGGPGQGPDEVRRGQRGAGQPELGEHRVDEGREGGGLSRGGEDHGSAGRSNDPSAVEAVGRARGRAGRRVAGRRRRPSGPDGMSGDALGLSGAATACGDRVRRQGAVARLPVVPRAGSTDAGGSAVVRDPRCPPGTRSAAPAPPPRRRERVRRCASTPRPRPRRSTTSARRRRRRRAAGSTA